MRVVLFDIDGTLLLTKGAGQQALRKAMLTVFDIGDPKDVPVHGQTDRGIATALFTSHGIEDTDQNWEQFLEAYLQHLQQELPLRQGHVLPGIAPLLGLLESDDRAAVGLLTGNVESGARLKLEFFGLHDYFAFGGFGDRHRLRADVARQAKSCAEHAVGGSIDPRDIWVIGDTPNDIRCAQAIGARVLAVGTGGYSMDELQTLGPDRLEADLSDHDRALAVLMGE